MKKGKIRLIAIVILVVVIVLGCGKNDREKENYRSLEADQQVMGVYEESAGIVEIEDGEEIPDGAKIDDNAQNVGLVMSNKQYEVEEAENIEEREWILPEGFDPYLPDKSLFESLEVEDWEEYFNEWVVYNYGIIEDPERQSFLPDGTPNPNAAWDRYYHENLIEEQDISTYPGINTVINLEEVGYEFTLAEYYREGFSMGLEEYEGEDGGRQTFLIPGLSTYGIGLYTTGKSNYGYTQSMKEGTNSATERNNKERWLSTETPWHDIATFDPVFTDAITLGYTEYTGREGEEIEDWRDFRVGMGYENTGEDKNYSLWTTEKFLEVSREKKGVPEGYNSWREFIDSHIDKYVIAASWIADPLGEATYWATTQDSWIGGAEGDRFGYTIPGLYVSSELIAEKVSDPNNQRDVWYNKYIDRMEEIASDENTLGQLLLSAYEYSPYIEQVDDIFEEGKVRNLLMQLGMTENTKFEVESEDGVVELEVRYSSGEVARVLEVPSFKIEGLRDDYLEAIPRLTYRQLATVNYFNLNGTTEQIDRFKESENYGEVEGAAHKSSYEGVVSLEGTRIGTTMHEGDEGINGFKINSAWLNYYVDDRTPISGYWQSMKSLVEYLQESGLTDRAEIRVDSGVAKYGPWAYVRTLDSNSYKTVKEYKFRTDRDILNTSFLLNTDFSGIGYKYNEETNSINIAVASVYGTQDSSMGSKGQRDPITDSFFQWKFGDERKEGEERTTIGYGATGVLKVYELTCYLDDNMKIERVESKEEAFNRNMEYMGVQTSDWVRDSIIILK
jgi:hypothetical protein